MIAMFKDEANQILDKEKTLVTADLLGNKSKKVGEFFLTENHLIFFFAKFSMLGLKVETYRENALILPLKCITHTSKTGGFPFLNALEVSLTKEGLEKVVGFFE